MAIASSTVSARIRLSTGPKTGAGESSAGSTSASTVGRTKLPLVAGDCRVAAVHDRLAPARASGDEPRCGRSAEITGPSRSGLQPVATLRAAAVADLLREHLVASATVITTDDADAGRQPNAESATIWSPCRGRRRHHHDRPWRRPGTARLPLAAARVDSRHRVEPTN
jgi:hypothetical protein